MPHDYDRYTKEAPEALTCHSCGGEIKVWYTQPTAETQAFRMMVTHLRDCTEWAKKTRRDPDAFLEKARQHTAAARAIAQS